jgi:hypothetical protein
LTKKFSFFILFLIIRFSFIYLFIYRNDELCDAT